MKRHAAWWILTVAGPALGASGPLPCNEPDVNCQLSDQAGHGSGSIVGAVSDANPAAGFAVRDNFIIDAGGFINTVCWTGLYVDFDAQVDCAPGTVPDIFTVTYFENIESLPGAPGNIVAGPFDVTASLLKSATGNLVPSPYGNLAEFEFSATHANVLAAAGECLWIEIRNDTTGSNPPCVWLWSTAPSAAKGGTGDGLSWQERTANDFDLAFCLNAPLGDPTACTLGIDPGCAGAVNPCEQPSGAPGCSDPVCCTLVCDQLVFCCVAVWDANCVIVAGVICGQCGDAESGNCFNANFTPFCDDQCGAESCIGCCQLVCAVDPYCCDASWDGLCASEAMQLCPCLQGGQPPANDDCQNAIPIGLGDTPIDNTCATSSPPEHATCSDGVFAGLGLDIWYRYDASFTGELVVSTCGQAGYDTQLAVYEGCDCQALSDPPLACNNDGVDCPPGTSLLVTDVVQGNCYLIRVGSGSVSPVGSGTLTLTAVPPNDECATMIEIDRLDANETIVEPVNMQVATASPEDSQCLGGPNTHKDLWYCLSNNTGVGKLVTITSDINVLIEITAGCLCPPGPLVACLPDIGINNTIEMAAGEQVTLRLIDDLDLPGNQLQGSLTISNVPTPPNNHCAGMIQIDRLDQNETILEPFDMLTATASPETSQCLGGPNAHEDLWYCLINNTGLAKLVTITSSVDLLIEITAGCPCPPGALVACLPDIDSDNTIEMFSGQQVTLRLINYLDLPDNQLQGTLTIINAPPPKPSIFHLSQASFDVAVLEACNATFSWDFTPNGLPPGGVSRPLDDPLDINTHADNPGDPWGELWPPQVNNVQFSSNMNPAGPLDPRSMDGLVFARAGAFNLTSELLGANMFTDSFNVVVINPVVTDTRAAMSMKLVSLYITGLPTEVLFRVTVFDSLDQELEAIDIPAMDAEEVFIGVLTEEGDTIGRVDVWDMNGNVMDGGVEGISTITTYSQCFEPCPWDCGDGDGNVGINDFLALLGQWATAGTCDFDGGTVGITDFLDLLANWGPCP